jgi:hypothetical protein
MVGEEIGDWRLEISGRSRKGLRPTRWGSGEKNGDWAVLWKLADAFLKDGANFQ